MRVKDIYDKYIKGNPHYFTESNVFDPADHPEMPERSGSGINMKYIFGFLILASILGGLWYVSEKKKKKEKEFKV